MCEECLSKNNRITPLLNSRECLENHTQYICGTFGRCICIENTNKGLQRWNFPFKTLEIAKSYLRVADYINKNTCGIYEIEDNKGRISYKIFKDNKDLLDFLKKNHNKTCKNMEPIYKVEEYKEYPNTQVRRLSPLEIDKYLTEQDSNKR